MKSFELTDLFLVVATITTGAFLGVLGNRLVAYNSQSKWRFGFYVLGIITFLLIPIYLFSVDNLVIGDYIMISFLGIPSLCLIIFTIKYLDRKSIFTTKELDPKINDFTSSSDQAEIKLFGGDLNFFGNTPSEMDQNDQYNHLKSLRFKKISILCEEPRSASTKIRYGKILHEMDCTILKFYNPEEADLLIRGRMKTIQGVEKLLVYTKIKTGIYQAIETDTANSNGALYNNIWKLIWSLAIEINNLQREDYIRIYRNN
jgi:hypothetical protein